jgi:hypothetical protein
MRLTIAQLLGQASLNSHHWKEAGAFHRNKAGREEQLIRWPQRIQTGASVVSWLVIQDGHEEA